MARNPDKHPKAGADRRAKIEALRQQEKKAERKRSLILVGSAVVVALALVGGSIAAVAAQRAKDPRNKSLSSFGVASPAASCLDPETVTATGSGDHIGPGTNHADVTHIDYTYNPPMFGQHWVFPAPFDRKFYTTKDVPMVEQLVHNLEHGYTVLWYSRDVSAAQKADLEGLSKRIPADRGKEKFIVAPWDTSRGALPEGKKFVLTHWGQKNGYRLSCGQLSGQVVKSFMDSHPYTDSPEPNAA